MKNNLVKLGSILLLGAITVSGCKKGENDPFLSFKSRDSRIQGTWTLSSQSDTQTDMSSFNGTVTTSTSTATFASGLMTEVSGGSTDAYSYSLELTINEDGTYTVVEIVDGNTSEATGSWNWVDDVKNKVKISLDGSVYQIDQLKSSEMVLVEESFYKSTDTSGDYTQSESSSTMTFTKE